jgi:hypothetical protein
MSRVVIFGYINGAPGTPQACAVQCQLNDHGDEVSTDIPNVFEATGRWAMIGDPHAPPPPLARPSASQNVVLSQRYWRTPVSGFAGDASLTGVFSAGTCIQVSETEALALRSVHAVASGAHAS